MDMPNFIVSPQYPIWITEDAVKKIAEDAEDGDDLEENSVGVFADSYTEDVPTEISEESDEEVGDSSFSTSGTSPASDSSSRLVDYAIVRVEADPIDGPQGQKIRYDRWHITWEKVVLLVEQKRYPSRSLSQAQLQVELRKRLNEAWNDLEAQAAHLFLKDPSMDSVMV
ncbi:hypothetical protein AcW1_009790 [Taiwanofungus camphoratus]|nr:hypothetical protein AcW1_009790 [Antrodia cinnamomea]